MGNFNTRPKVIRRLLTGLCHYVYYIKDYKQNSYIIRASTVENKNYLRGSIYWLNKLHEYNLPISKILAEGINDEVPYIILSYISGDDLGNVYLSLTEQQKKILARKMVSIQRELEKIEIPYNNRYGYLFSFEDSNFKNSWIDVIKEHINRSKDRINNNAIFDVLYVHRVEELLVGYLDYLSKVKAIPFFDDATTKNVLIDNGLFAGIIDLDSICFGDKLYQVALTKMSLLSSNYDTHYIDYWIEELKLNEEEIKILDLYTLIFCVDFMSEIGMKFNKEEPIRPNKKKIKRLKELFENICSRL